MGEALWAHQRLDASAYRKLDEQPYDFMRKRLSVLLATPDRHLLITKGAVDSMLRVCSSMELPDGAIVLVIRTRRPFFKSPPSAFFLASTGAVIILTISLPFLPVAAPLGLTPLPLLFMAVLAAILASYVFAAEIAKSQLYGNGRA